MTESSSHGDGTLPRRRRFPDAAVAGCAPCPASPAPSSSRSATPRCPTCSGPDVRLLFVGINPGLWTAATQTHFAHPGNRFYPALLRAGILEQPDRPVRRDDRRRPRPAARPRHRHHQPRPPGHRPADELDRRRAARGRRARSRRWYAAPRRASSRSPASRRTAPPSGARRRRPGRQPEPLAGAELWVVPNPSGLNAHETVATLAAAYAAPARAAGIL